MEDIFHLHNLNSNKHKENRDNLTYPETKGKEGKEK
jgi:hypothetical protein